MALAILFMSCEQYDNDITENQLQNSEIDGEELFKSIIFADGQLTSNIPSLQSISQKNKMSKDQLIEFRAFQEEIISFLKTEDNSYFNDFKDAMYSGDPEIVSDMITKAAKDILPLVNAKLAPLDLTIEKMVSENKIDTDSFRMKGGPDVGNEQSCGVIVVVAVAAAVAAAVIWVVVISAVAVVSSNQVEQATLTQDAISIQVAEELSLGK